MSQSMNPLEDHIVKALHEAVASGIISFFTSLARPIATLTESIFRKEMGERYFTGWDYGFGMLSLLIFGLPYPLMILGKGTYDNYGHYYKDDWVAADWAPVIAMVVWMVIFSGLFYLHNQTVARRYSQNIPWHSRATGLARLPIPYFLEKIIPLVGGVILVFFCHFYGLGALMFISGVISIILRGYETMKFQGRMLDVMDANIEQTCMALSVKDNCTPDKVQGLETPLPAYVGTNFRASFAEALEKEQKSF